MSWEIPSGQFTGSPNPFWPDVAPDAFMYASDALEEFYATDSIDDLQASGDALLEKLMKTEKCKNFKISHRWTHLEYKKNLWSERVRKIKILNDRIVAKNKKKGLFRLC